MPTVYRSNPAPLVRKLKRRFATLGRVLTFAQWQKERRNERPLRRTEMLDTVDAAIKVLRGLYVHIDLKRARRGVDPIQQLSVFREQLDIPSKRRAMPTRAFHEVMLRIFKSLGDAHTAYRLPAPHNLSIAFLPFLIGAYQKDRDERGFVVSHVLREAASGLKEQRFAPGVEIVTWNGVAIEDAVKAATDFEEGSNTPNDFLLTLQFMTVRWLGASFGPESPWVVVGYKDARGEYHESFFYWLALHLRENQQIIASAQAVAALFKPFRSLHGTERAIHVGSASVHVSRKALFLPKASTKHASTKALERLGRELMSMFFGYVGRAELQAFTDKYPLLRRDARSDEHPTLLPEFLDAREHALGDLVKNAGAARPARMNPLLRFGYIGIRAFPLMGFPRELFSYELRRLLSLMPGDGLIVDIRDNPGGSATLAEEALQLLTPNTITPLPFRFIASPDTRTIAKKGGSFADYEASIETAIKTGGRFSAGRPITSVQHANEAGQHYFGPVVLLTNGATYSAADVFAAGFMDHEIGTVIGLDETTGGGGANCWFYQDDIIIALKGGAPDGSKDGAKPLPRGINLQIAVRQCSRIGKNNDGVPIEEIGVPSYVRGKLTREDILQPRPWSLLLQAGELLADPSQGTHCGLLTALVQTGETRRVEVTTTNIHRVDFFVNGRPTSVDVDGSAPMPDKAISPELPQTERVVLEIRGYVRPDQLVARHVQVFPFIG